MNRFAFLHLPNSVSPLRSIRYVNSLVSRASLARRRRRRRTGDTRRHLDRAPSVDARTTHVDGDVLIARNAVLLRESANHFLRSIASATMLIADKYSDITPQAVLASAFIVSTAKFVSPVRAFPTTNTKSCRRLIALANTGMSHFPRPFALRANHVIQT